MNISFKKNIHHSYMVIEQVSGFSKYHFFMKMAEENEIARLLKVSYERMNGQYQMLYDITAKQAFCKLFETEKLSFAQLCAFLFSLQELVQSLKEYLLEPDNIILKQECIFADAQGLQFAYCYFPYYHGDLLLELRALFAQLLTMVNKEEEKAVRLMHELHEEVQKDNVSIFRLSEIAARFTQNSDLKIRQVLPLSAWQEETREQKEEADKEMLFSAKPSEHSLAAQSAVKEASLFDKLRTYLKGKHVMDVIEDINNRTFMGKIKECADERNEREVSLQSDFSNAPEEAAFTYIPLSNHLREDAFFEEAPYEGTVLLGSAESEVRKLVGMHAQQGGRFLLRSFPFTVGSDAAQCDACLDAPEVSRLHARIYEKKKGVYEIEDLNSTNGTFVNEKRLAVYEKAPLQEGDILRFAEEEYCFR